jgi:hypothetical protein
MLDVVVNYRRLIACLAIALQGVGAIVGGLGHSHYGAAACCPGSEHHDHGGKCSHSHGDAAPARPAEGPATDPTHPADPHDDCSLCRHFSQPASPITLTIEMPRCERVELLIVAAAKQFIAATPAAHPARGPPALLA